MYRTHKGAIAPLKKIILASSLLAFALPAFAGEKAPIRYASATNVPTISTTDYMPTGKTANRPDHADGFWYPDEPIGNRGAMTPQFSQPAPVKTAAFSDDIPESFTKIGNPYTINGKTYYPEYDPFYDEIGVGSWYGPGFHGGKTANGEIFDMDELTAAHPTLPMPCLVKVTNLENGRELIVRVNDRGPFKKDRVIDLSRAAAERLDMIKHGSARVRVEYFGEVGDAPLGTPPAPKQYAETVSGDHYLQLASFSEKGNARSFLERISDYSDMADIVSAQVNGSKHYRVVIGPFNSKTDADSEKQIMASNGFNGLVIRNP